MKLLSSRLVPAALFTLLLAGCGEVEPPTTDAPTTDAPTAACAEGSCGTGYECDLTNGCVPRYGRSAAVPGTSCADILGVLGTATDGAYWIDPDGGATENSFEAYCDMTTAGGGWTLVYKYIGTGEYSQDDLLASDFAGPSATIAPLALEPSDGIHRRVHGAFWAAKGRTWMSTWTLYNAVDDQPLERNHAVFELESTIAWSDVAIFPAAECTLLPGKVTVKVHDAVTDTLVTVGSSSYRLIGKNKAGTLVTDGRGFLAADPTQISYHGLCAQPASNVLTYPPGLIFSISQNRPWPNVLAHFWYMRHKRDRDKDRCSYQCWDKEQMYSGREFWVR